MSSVSEHRCPCGAVATLKTPWGGMCTKCIAIEPAGDLLDLVQEAVFAYSASELEHSSPGTRLDDAMAALREWLRKTEP